MSKQIPLPSEDQLLRFIKADDAIAILKRGHNMLALSMKYLVYSYLPRPSENVWNFKYDRLVSLCDSLGLVTQEEATYLRYVNTVRDASEHDDDEIRIPQAFWIGSNLGEGRNPDIAGIWFQPRLALLSLIVAIFHADRRTSLDAIFTIRDFHLWARKRASAYSYTLWRARAPHGPPWGPLWMLTGLRWRTRYDALTSGGQGWNTARDLGALRLAA